MSSAVTARAAPRAGWRWAAAHRACQLLSTGVAAAALVMTGGCDAAPTPARAPHPGPASADGTAGVASPPVARTLTVTPSAMILPNHTSADILALSPTTGVIDRVGRLPQPTHDAGGVLFPGRVLVFGGGVIASTDDVQSTAPDGTGAAVIGHLPQPRSDDAVASDGGTAYVVGGYPGSAELPDVLATTDGKSFRTVAKLVETVRYPAAVVDGGILWVLGGEHDGTATSDVQRVDLTTGAVTVAGHLPVPLAHAAATVLDGTVLLIGGSDGPAHEATIYRFTPATASVTAVGSLPAATSDAAVAVLGHSAYVVGGETSDAAGNVSTLNTVVGLRFSR